jgi:hypothetical protein
LVRRRIEHCSGDTFRGLYVTQDAHSIENIMDIEEDIILSAEMAAFFGESPIIDAVSKKMHTMSYWSQLLLVTDVDSLFLLALVLWIRPP